jgi:NDP-sugar pyrophosphorylase family protein
MKAILLAAGLGTRLGAAAGGLPKCMVEIGGTPVLAHNLEWLAASGIAEVAVNLHFRPEIVKAHFGDGSAFGASIRWSYEPELLGTAGTLWSLRDWLGGERFLVVYADNLIGCDLAAVTNLHERRGAMATVALFSRDDVSRSGVAELDHDDRILRFVEKPQPRQTASRWVSAGLLVLEPSALRYAPKTGDVGRDLLPALLAASEPVIGYRMGQAESLFWIDTPEDLARTTAGVGGSAR